MTDPTTPLRLFNSMTRQIEGFVPVHPGTEGDPTDPPEARVYTCGPTVYNFQHIGNMRAYIFADTLGRALSFKGYKLKHVINITDVGHLTSDADAGDDKMEAAAAKSGKTAWDIAAFYTNAYWHDIERLNIRQPLKWSIASDYVPQMIAFAESIADKHCYQLESGLYFDTSTVADYGKLARAVTEDGAGRIDAVTGKRHAADFAIWRTTPRGETRQMEWESPWGRGAPGWHLECSVMSEALLGLPFDIHTGGIDHREIHHPNEIAQNQAWTGSGALKICEHSGARIWMHNNFLIDRTGKMSKSTGEFLTLQALVDRGFHPLAYRMMCLQAHYRSELEFSWENLAAAFTRLKRLVSLTENLGKLAELWIKRNNIAPRSHKDWLSWKLEGKNVEGINQHLDEFSIAIADDLNTPKALSIFEKIMFLPGIETPWEMAAVATVDKVFGLDLENLTRDKLRIRPVTAPITKDQIDDALAARTSARAAKDFAKSDAIRDDLIAKGVEVMDGDPLGWDWKLEI